MATFIKTLLYNNTEHANKAQAKLGWTPREETDHENEHLMFAGKAAKC